MDKPIEKIEIEHIGASALMIRKWFSGYNIEDAGVADTEEFLDEGSLDAMLTQFEKEGFSVWISRRGFGHAIRGPVTRVDIVLEGDAWVMRKFQRGWKAQTRPIECKRFSLPDAEIAIQWLKDHHWQVLAWPGGYRAFKGRPMPVRDANAIRAMRRKFDEQKINFTWDLALYF